MKRIALFILLMVAVTVTSFAQRRVMANYTDTLTNVQIKYYPAEVMPELAYGSFQIYVDHLSGTSDSTWVYIQGSADNSTWQNLSSTAYSSSVLYSSGAATEFKTVRFIDADAGFIWNIGSLLTMPYYRYAVYHYGTGTVRVKGWSYKKEFTVYKK